ncbi:MAG: hypothetical protein K2Q06_11385, partial [Parvularculaceae bacterium]|nr:hypothetical protein [Parvularculaceae bacterium]
MDLSPEAVMQMSGFALYLGLFLLPFVQEDAAVVAAATASLTKMGPLEACFAAVLAGLICSDVWKYWAGYLARRYRWAHRFAEKPGVAVAGDLVRNNLGKTLMIARFVPGTRIPSYVACGFFQTPYLKFCVIVALSAFTYVAVMFALFETVGAVAGDQAKYWLPGIILSIVAGYLIIRWARRRGRKAAAIGPLAPLSNEPDRPMPDMPGFGDTPLETEPAAKKDAHALRPH